MNIVVPQVSRRVHRISTMNLAQGLERRLEKFADSASASLFRGRMHPVSIATRLMRQLEFVAVDTPAGPQVPNHLVVQMNPTDIDPELDRSALVSELENAVTHTSMERGWRVVGAVRISVRTDGDTPRGIVECTGESVEGALAPWSQLIADDGSAVLTVSLNRTLIGRDLDCDVRVANQEVSRHHCVVYRDGSRTFLKDLGSSNGTTLNGKRLGGQPAAIAAGDNVLLGDLSFTFRTVN